jgi:hypothetical protein
MLVRVGAPSREVNNGALCAIYHFFKRFDFSRLLSDVLLINSVLCSITTLHPFSTSRESVCPILSMVSWHSASILGLCRQLHLYHKYVHVTRQKDGCTTTMICYNRHGALEHSLQTCTATQNVAFSGYTTLSAQFPFPHRLCPEIHRSFTRSLRCKTRDYRQVLFRSITARHGV